MFLPKVNAPIESVVTFAPARAVPLKVTLPPKPSTCVIVLSLLERITSLSPLIVTVYAAGVAAPSLLKVLRLEKSP